MAKRLFEIKKLFFNKSNVIKYLDRKTLKVLNKFGGLVRKTAQRSMRSRKGSQKSGQGKPPYAHGRRLLRKLLFYYLDRQKKEVVIGPVLIGSTKAAKVPKLMEQGGTVAELTKAGRTERKQYKGNPFMKPAFDMHVGSVAAMYKNT